MNAAVKALQWLEKNNIKVTSDGVTLKLTGKARVSPKVMARIIALKPLIIEALNQVEKPPQPKPRLCETCGSIATHAIGHYPAQGIEGVWFCAEHVPPRERIEAAAIPAIVQDNMPGSSEIKRGRFLELRNIVTGVTTTIDLHAKQQRVRVERSQPRREEKIINAQRINQDEASPPVDYKLLQDVADTRNQLAEQEHETDRYCRCGNLAQTQWRLDGKLVWMCSECF